ncbi:MAG: hypothetical protein ACTS3F_13080 [Phycisphaerales bacterium]
MAREGRGRSGVVAVRAMVLTLVAGGLVGAAQGQNALGDGRALDRNPQVGSGGRNAPGHDFRADIAFRNAIVTGNVTGNLGFRGDVGYTGAFDFRGSTADEEFFRFEARSTSSADVLNFHQTRGRTAQDSSLRGLGATQQAMGWSVAGGRGAMIVDRTFSGTSAARIDQAIRDPLGGAAGITIDEYPRLRGSIRSTSDLIARTPSEPSRLGIIEDQSGNGARSMRVGSDLLAVRDLPMRPRTALDGVPLMPSPELLSSWRDPGEGLVPPIDGAGGGVDDPFGIVPVPGTELDPDAALDPLRGMDGQAGDGTGALDPLTNRLPTNRLSPDVSPYRTAMESLRIRNDRIETRAAGVRGTERATEIATERVDGSESSMSWVMTLDERLAAIRASLLSGEGDGVGDVDGGGSMLDRVLSESERAMERERLRLELREMTPEERAEWLRDPEVVEAMSRSDAAVEMAREALAETGVVVRTLTTRPANERERSVFERHMSEGQSLLGEGSFFAAEERFTAALFIVPGDPLAAAGRVHAQIGAGMYRSATLNLRTLLRNYPEMAGVRFDASLLPSGERLQTTLDRLRERTDPKVPMSQEAGLLLAYMGHQLGNDADVRRGLAAAREVARATEREVDPLVALLEAVWIAEGGGGTGDSSGDSGGADSEGVDPGDGGE